MVIIMKVSPDLEMDEVVSIEKSYEIQDPLPSVSDRYYERYYYRDPKGKTGDQIISVHSNRVCLVSLHPNHPFTSKKDSLAFDFQVTPALNRLKNEVSGKLKKGGQALDTTANLCFIKHNDTTMAVKSCVRGKLLEVNKALLENPALAFEEPLTNGYIAIVLLKLPEELINIKERLLTEKQYLDLIKEKPDL